MVPATTTDVLAIRPGDKVKLRLRNGQDVKMQVASVETEAVVGVDGRRVPVVAIATVERRSFSVIRSVMLVPLGLVVMGIIAGLTVPPT